MAQLKDTLITGGLRVTDTIITNVLLATAIRALTSSSGTTYGLGDNGLVLLTDGASKAYWSSINPSITITDGDSSNAPKVNLTVLGSSGTTALALNKASISAYGVTKLVTDASSTASDLAATPQFVRNYLADGLAANDAMVFKGTLGTGGTITSVPTQAYTDADGKHYSKGWTYKIITDGVYAGEYCEAGDLLIAITDSNETGTSSVDEHWVKVLTNVDGPIYLGRKTNNTFNDVTTNALLKFTGTGRATASSGIISDETNKRLSLFDIFAYLRVIFNMGSGPIEAGWRRVCTISNLSVYPQFFITISGGYNSVAPTGAIIAVSARTTNRQMSLLSCSGLYGSEKLKKVRLINIGNNSCYFDIYCDAHTGTGSWGNIIFNFVGNITISEIQTATTINTDTGGAELTFRNIKDLPIFTLQDNDGTNSTTSTFTHYDLTLTLPATIKATLTGNASTATAFAAEQSIELTGDTTGSTSSAAGWSITTKTDRLSYVGDNRSVATIPNDYNGKLIFLGLKTENALGMSTSTGTYAYLLGLRGWSNNTGGKAHELAFKENGIYWRTGATDTWDNDGVWKKIALTNSLEYLGTNNSSASNYVYFNLDLPLLNKNNNNWIYGTLKIGSYYGNHYPMGLVTFYFYWRKQDNDNTGTNNGAFHEGWYYDPLNIINSLTMIKDRTNVDTGAYVAYLKIKLNDDYCNIWASVYTNLNGNNIYNCITGTSYTSTAIETDVMSSCSATKINNANDITGITFSNDTNGVKMSLARAGYNISALEQVIPKVSSSTAGVAPKGTAVSSLSLSTKFLREDGTWAAPSYTTNTNTDTLVNQEAKTNNTAYKLLATAKTSSGKTAEEAVFVDGITITPDTKTITTSIYALDNYAKILYNTDTNAIDFVFLP